METSGIKTERALFVEQKLVCKRCGRVFEDLDALRLHVNGHKWHRRAKAKESDCNLEQCRRFLDCDCLGLYQSEEESA